MLSFSIPAAGAGDRCRRLKYPSTSAPTTTTPRAAAAYTGTLYLDLSLFIWSWLDHALPDGEAYEARDVTDFECGHDPAAIGVNAAGLDAEDGGNLLAGPALDHEL